MNVYNVYNIFPENTLLSIVLSSLTKCFNNAIP